MMFLSFCCVICSVVLADPTKACKNGIATTSTYKKSLSIIIADPSLSRMHVVVEVVVVVVGSILRKHNLYFFFVIRTPSNFCSLSPVLYI